MIIKKLYILTKKTIQILLYIIYMIYDTYRIEYIVKTKAAGIYRFYARIIQSPILD